MRLPGSARPPENTDLRVGTPLCAGLVLPAGPVRLTNHEIPSALLSTDVRRTAEKAISVLNGASHELGLSLYVPTLMSAAGDELGAVRHHKALKRVGGTR